jgi:hypothetical protein
MDALTQQLMMQLAGPAINQISQKIGVDPQTANTALSIAVPLLVSALAKNASDPAGAQALHQAVTNDHDGSILNNVGGLINNPEAANGAGILNHVLGSQQSTVTQGLTQGTGMSSEQVSQLLQIAAPLLMGALGQQQQQQGLDPNGMSQYLGTQQQAAQQSNPDVMGVLNNLLDSNHDGSALDDMLGLAGKLLGGQ